MNDRLDRATAYVALLALPDEPPMRRSHRLTQPGSPSRFVDTWLPIARGWLVERLRTTNAEMDSWKPAMRVRRRFGT